MKKIILILILIIAILFFLVLYLFFSNSQAQEQKNNLSNINNIENSSRKTLSEIFNSDKLTKNNCFSNKYNCSDFSLQGDAQKLFDYCWDIKKDIHQLDKDKDGIACESLQ